MKAAAAPVVVGDMLSARARPHESMNGPRTPSTHAACMHTPARGEVLYVKHSSGRGPAGVGRPRRVVR